MTINQVIESYVRRVSQVDLLLFTKHFSVMLKSGIPISEAVSILAEQSTGNLRGVVKKIQANVDNGQSLHKSLEEFPYIFDQFYVGLVKIGETSGNLDKNLEYLAAHMGKEYATRQRVKSAMLYPTIVLVATVLIGGYISFFILPQLLVFFEAFGTDLPLTTQIMLFLARGAVSYGWLAVVALPVFWIVGTIVLRIPAIKYIWDWIGLHMAIFGKINQNYQLARFTRNCGLLLKSGVPIMLAMETTRDAGDNLVYKEAVNGLVQSVQAGRFLGESIMTMDRVDVFPPMVGRMLSVGDKTGKLDEILLYLGDFYDEEIETITKNLSTVLEPVLLLIIGLVVGFVALAIITPIYELTSSLG